jgi:hypothetical protein
MATANPLVLMPVVKREVAEYQRKRHSGEVSRVVKAG